ncbi:MAG: hypothetical protein QOE92_788 [Chloroflexota bacterium]|jgi:hypothetical protein|nr:hypothetical protein [Chloroflexota bacterium]
MENESININKRGAGFSRRALLTMAACGAIGGSFVGGVILASAATTPSPAASPASGTPAQPNVDPTKGGHVANGVTEQLLTGDTADKARAAAMAAVPGGTIERVENDAEGATYEAHMVKSDGSHVTVKMDGDFKVTGVEDGPAGGRR